MVAWSSADFSRSARSLPALLLLSLSQRPLGAGVAAAWAAAQNILPAVRIEAIFTQHGHLHPQPALQAAESSHGSKMARTGCPALVFRQQAVVSERFRLNEKGKKEKNTFLHRYTIPDMFWDTRNTCSAVEK